MIKNVGRDISLLKRFKRKENLEKQTLCICNHLIKERARDTYYDQPVDYKSITTLLKQK